MTDVMSEIMGQEKALPNNEELQEIHKLAEMQLHFEQKISGLELDLTDLKEKHRYISENLLPEAMSNCGMKEFTMHNGLKLKVKEDIHSSIRKDFLNEAIYWLDVNELGGIVKDDVSVKFGKGESERAKALVDWCETNGYNAEEKLSVHPMTLKATVKEQMAKGVVFPEEFFSIYSSRKTEIKVK